MASFLASPRIQAFVDSSVRWAAGAVAGATIYAATWGVVAERRIHDLEIQVTELQKDVDGLKQDTANFVELKTSIAVVSTKLDEQDKKYDRIEDLLSKMHR